MGRVATVAVLALTVGTLPASAAKVERVDVPGGTLRLAVPSTWARIPATELELRALFAAEATGGAAAEVYSAAFAPRGAIPAVAPPLLLVQGHRNGRMSWARFTRLPTPDEIDSQAAARLVGSGVPFGDHTSVQEVAFDRDRYALELKTRVDRTPWGPLDVRSALFLTSAGGVAVHALFRVDAQPPVDDMWRSVLTSVTLDEGLEYTPRLRDLWPWLLAWPVTWYVAAVVVAAFAVWVAVRDRHRRGAS